MALHQQKLNYTSPLWCVHQSWHTQTYPTRPNNQPYANGCGETLDQNSKTQSSSLRLPYRTSIRLLSRISKFEALDALSGPTRLPSMRPAHLQLSQSSISGKRTDTSHTRRLSTIFSPTSDNREQYTTFPSEDEFTSGRDILGSTTTKKLFPSKKLGLRKLRKSQVSFKSSSIRMRGGVRDPVDVIVDKGIEVAREPYAPKEVPLKKRTIRDMIRFYDGSTDNNASNGSSHFQTVSLTDDALRQRYQKTLARDLLCPLQHKLHRSFETASVISNYTLILRRPGPGARWSRTRMLLPPHLRNLASPSLILNVNRSMENTRRALLSIPRLRPRNLRLATSLPVP